MDVERRPHWTDDLIEAVSAQMPSAYDIDVGDLRLYAVIAAVEDWHKAKRDSRDRTHSDECWRWHQECAEQLIEQQQAAIDRVVRLAANWQRRFDSSIRHPADIASIPIEAVFSALDGADDE